MENTSYDIQKEKFMQKTVFNTQINTERIETIEQIRHENDSYVPAIKTENLNIDEDGDPFTTIIVITMFSGKEIKLPMTLEEFNKV
jgi:hypothetical protein